MDCEALVLDGDPAALADRVRALVAPAVSVREAVAQIIAAVRTGGDAALAEFTRRFDTAGADPLPPRVGDAALGGAATKIDPAIRIALERSADNVGRVAEAGIDSSRTVAFNGYEVVLREVPVDRAGVYVPGGRAPYPSTVVMGVVAARAAGVRDVAVCSPVGPGKEIDDAVLAACALTGASVVYRVGGAQAIAALAYGTESVTPVDVIAGPGNVYVQEAKRQVSDRVGIDGFAGPSDLLAIADPGTEPEPLALDLLAQAEHGPGTLVVAVSQSRELLASLQATIMDAPGTGAIARTVLVKDPEEALRFAQAFAPEHIELIGREAEALASRVTHAGSVFVGRSSATAFGDYIAGSNHILPTDGAARFASALSPAHFRRRFTEVRIGDRAAAELARVAAPLARAEGFELHARSMEARIRDNGRSR